MDTLLIDEEFWDCCVTADRHIAVCSNPYALAQGASCAIKTFIGEDYYNTDEGIPYRQQILGESPPLALIKAQLSRAANTVPEVVASQVFLESFEDDVFKGQVQVVDENGAITIAGF